MTTADPDLKAAAVHLVDDLDARMKVALQAGAELIAKDARARAPILQNGSSRRVPGSLRESVRAASVGTSDRPAATVTIDPEIAFYGNFQELGFRAVGRRRGGDARRPSTVPGASGEAGRFVPGQHFLLDAFRADTPKVVQLVGAAVKGGLDKASS